MQEDLATDDVMLLDTWDQVGEGQKVKALWASESGRSQTSSSKITCQKDLKEPVLLGKSLVCCYPLPLSEPPFPHLQSGSDSTYVA